MVSRGILDNTFTVKISIPHVIWKVHLKISRFQSLARNYDMTYAIIRLLYTHYI